MVEKITFSMPEHLYKWHIEPYKEGNISQHVCKLITIGAAAETDNFGKLRKENVELNDKLIKIQKERDQLNSEVGLLKEKLERKKEEKKETIVEVPDWNE